MKLTKEILKEKLNALIIKNNENYYSAFSYDKYALDEKNALEIRWTTGENVGGSCWGGEAKYEPIDNQEPKFNVLENLILSINEDYSLKSYLKIMDMVEYDKSYSSDYYGNGTYYSKKSIDLDKLLDELNIYVNDDKSVKINEKMDVIEEDISSSKGGTKKYKKQ